MLVWRLRTGISISLYPVDRRRLSTVVLDRNAPHKLVCLAEIVLFSAVIVITIYIILHTFKSYSCVWLCQLLFFQSIFFFLFLYYTLPSLFPPLFSYISHLFFSLSLSILSPNLPIILLL